MEEVKTKKSFKRFMIVIFSGISIAFFIIMLGMGLIPLNGIQILSFSNHSFFTILTLIFLILAIIANGINILLFILKKNDIIVASLLNLLPLISIVTYVICLILVGEKFLELPVDVFLIVTITIGYGALISIACIILCFALKKGIYFNRTLEMNLKIGRIMQGIYFSVLSFIVFYAGASLTFLLDYNPNMKIFVIVMIVIFSILLLAANILAFIFKRNIVVILFIVISLILGVITTLVTNSEKIEECFIYVILIAIGIGILCAGCMMFKMQIPSFVMTIGAIITIITGLGIAIGSVGTLISILPEAIAGVGIFMPISSLVVTFASDSYLKSERDY